MKIYPLDFQSHIFGSFLYPSNKVWMIGWLRLLRYTSRFEW